MTPERERAIERSLEMLNEQQKAEQGFPRGVAMPGEEDVVQVLMPQRMVRVFERRCLPVAARLAGPVVFSADDVPTYVIQLPSPIRRPPRES